MSKEHFALTAVKAFPDYRLRLTYPYRCTRVASSFSWR
jgi:hypothetical protein